DAQGRPAAVRLRLRLRCEGAPCCPGARAHSVGCRKRAVVHFLVGTKSFDGDEGDPKPTLLCAATVQLYVLPAVRPPTLIGDLSPSFCRATPPSLDVHFAR